MNEQQNLVYEISPYVLSEKIYEGMFSDIYLAGHEEMGLECVLKFPRYSVGLELIMTTFESNVSILEEEAEILGWWQDIPNVVRLLDVSFDVESPIVPFIVLEKLGRSLDDEIGRSGIGGSRTMIKSICDIAEALDAIHEEGMAHLDVKPENILFDPTQNAWKLIDPAGHSSMGTESYRARGVTEGWERDILALGRTFLTMYTGSEVEGDYGLDNFDDFYDEYWIDRRLEEFFEILPAMIDKRPNHMRPNASQVREVACGVLDTL